MICVWNLPIAKRLCNYCNVTNCLDRNTKWGKLSTKIRTLKPGESLTMDAFHHASCRTVAYRMAKQFDKQFSVRKNENGTVTIKRIKQAPRLAGGQY